MCVRVDPTESVRECKLLAISAFATCAPNEPVRHVDNAPCGGLLLVVVSLIVVVPLAPLVVVACSCSCLLSRCPRTGCQ